MALAIDPHSISAERSVHLASRVGRLLFLSGADTQHVLTGVSGVAQGLGQEVHVLVTPEAILATVGTTDRFVTKLGPEFSVPSVNMERLAAVETLIDDIKGGLKDADIIEQRLDAIELSPQGYSALNAIIGVGFTSASLAKLLGAEWSVVAAAFVAGILSGALRKIFAQFSDNPLMSVFIVAGISGLTAILVLKLVPHASPVLALTAAGMILVPGVPLINGIREISSGNAANGVTRLATGAASVLTIAFALYAVGSLSGAMLPIDQGPGSLSPLPDLLFAGLAAAGFAITFNVSPRAVGFCIAAGMASHALRTSLEQAGMTLPMASFVGAFAAGAIARLAARVYRAPAVTFAFPGVVALIPGSYGFRAGIGGLAIMTQGSAASPLLVSTTIALAITTMVTTTAIGIGIALSLAGSGENTHSTH